jgi:nicotinate-nucleotide adenylyltransferase
MARPGTPTPDPAELAARLGLPDVRLVVVDAPRIDIASSDLRRRAAEGRSLRYLLPRAVECYVRDKRLYEGAGTAD